jgi:threonine aldolase
MSSTIKFGNQGASCGNRTDPASRPFGQRFTIGTRRRPPLLPVDLYSDNVAPAAPEILAALARVNAGPAQPYGRDPESKAMKTAFSDLFGCEVWVMPVSTRTAANSIALSALTPPYGTILCSDTAHIQTSECGATELFSGGAKLTHVPAESGRMTADALNEGYPEGRQGPAAPVPTSGGKSDYRHRARHCVSGRRNRPDRRAGQVWSKMRYSAAQLNAYIEDELWLRLAAQANMAAKRLSEGLGQVPGIRMIETVEINQLFIEMPYEVIAGLEADGIGLGRRDEGVRMVTAWCTTTEEIAHVVKRARFHGGAARGP